MALRELIAGGAPRRLGASRAAKLLQSIRPQGAAGVERKRLALELLANLRRLDRDIASAKRRVSDAPTALLRRAPTHDLTQRGFDLAPGVLR